MTVSAIGRNSFPSTPSSARIGRYTMMMISSPKSVGFRTSTAASRTISRTLRSEVSSSRRREAFSTMITELSTTRPKSMAPRLIRLPAMPNRNIALKANSIDSGMAKRDDQAGAKLSQEDEEHGDDEQRAFEQVVPDRAQHLVDQGGAAVDRLERDARRHAALRLGEAGFEALGQLAAVLSDQHEARAPARPRPCHRRSRRRAGSRDLPRTDATSRRWIGAPSTAATTMLSISATLETRPWPWIRLAFAALVQAATGRVSVVRFAARPRRRRESARV